MLCYKKLSCFKYDKRITLSSFEFMGLRKMFIFAK